MADLSAAGTGIQWYAAASGGSALATTVALVDGTYYYASQSVSGCESSTRLEVNATVTTNPTISLNSSTNPTTCSGTNGAIQLSLGNVVDGTYSLDYIDGSASESVVYRNYSD